MQSLQSEIGHEKKRNMGIKSKNEILEKQVEEYEQLLNKLESENQTLKDKINGSKYEIETMT